MTLRLFDVDDLTNRILPVGGSALQVPIKQADGSVVWGAQTGGGGGSSADASTTVKGVSKLSVAPVLSTNPIAAGDNDTRLTADQAAGTASIRTLGTGAQQATAGNDSRLSDTRTPTDGTVTNVKVSSSAAIAESKLSLASDAAAGTASRRTLGTGSTQAAAGDHTHTRYHVFYWAFSGTAAITTGVMRVPVPFTGTLVKAWATANTAPTGAALLFDINYDGTTVWSTQTNRLTIAAAGNSGTQTTFNTTAVTADHYVSCDIDQIGSTVAGSNIVVALQMSYVA